jgi:aryl-alcohol dehydrogenase-like predicted oxidoreductase
MRPPSAEEKAMIFDSWFPLGYGAGPLGTALTGDAALRHVAVYLEAGGNVFDTAHCYACWQAGGVGASERELGRVLRELGVLETAIVMTKGGHPAFEPEYPRPAHFLAPEVIQQDIADSCERLGAGSLSVYFLHRDDGVTPVTEIMEPLQDSRLGLLGASNWSVARLREANDAAGQRGWKGFTLSQVQGSLATPTWPITADPTVRYLTQEELDFGLPLTFYSATANGYFAGRDVGDYRTPENEARRERARELAVKHGATPTQIALAYLRHLPTPALPLFSTTNEAHLQECLGAATLTLSLDETRWLREG